jgi:hypothetical protein
MLGLSTVSSAPVSAVLAVAPPSTLPVAADLVEAANAADVLDGIVEPAQGGIEWGGGYYTAPRPRPFPVEGYGYGILPELRGEAHGVVGIASNARGVFPPLRGTAGGAAGNAGHGVGATPTVLAMAIWEHGQVGGAVGVLQSFTAVGKGQVVACGRSSGVIGNIKGAASGRHDDDEAVAWLLVA